MSLSCLTSFALRARLVTQRGSIGPLVYYINSEKTNSHQLRNSHQLTSSFSTLPKPSPAVINGQNPLSAACVVARSASTLTTTTGSGNSGLLFRQMFDKESWTYTYVLADDETREAVIIDPVIDQVERDIKMIEVSVYCLMNKRACDVNGCVYLQFYVYHGLSRKN